MWGTGRASPAAADVCNDFRAALALKDVAWRAFMEQIEAGSPDVDAAASAYHAAKLAIGIPARAVERTIVTARPVFASV